MKKLIYSLSLLLIALSAMAQGPTNGLTADFKFNGNLTDASPNNVIVTSPSSTYTVSRTNQANGAISLNTSQGVILPQNFYRGGDLSFSGWINVSSFGNYSRVFTFGRNFIPGATGISVICLRFGNNVGDLTIEGGNGVNTALGGVSISAPLAARLATNTWYHIGFTKLGTTYSIYVNGSLVASGIGAEMPVGDNIFVNNMLNLSNNQSYDTGSNIFYDDVRFYNRALEPCEINQLAGIANPVLATPSFVATPPANVCAGTALINYNISTVSNATSYEWKIDGTIISGPSLTLSKAWSATDATVNNGNHAVTVAAKNACGTSAVLTSNVNVAAVPAAPTGLTGLSSGFCKATTQRYSVTQGTAGTVYAWSLGNTVLPDFTGNIAYINIANPGSQVVSVAAKSTNGACQSAPASLTVTANDAPQNTIIAGNTMVCPRAGNVSYSIPNFANGASYFWIVDNGVKTNFVNGTSTNVLVDFPDVPGNTYTIKVTSSNNCGSSVATKLVQIQPNAPAKPNLTCQGTGCTQLTVINPDAATAVTWYVNGAAIPTPNPRNTINTPTGQSAYVVFSKGTDSNGNSCSNASNGYPFGGPPCTNGRIEAEEVQLPSEKAYSIYPNPSSGQVTIETKGQVGKAYVYNTFGQVVAEVDLNASEFLYTVSLSSKGLYTFKFKSGDETKGYKLVVE